MDQTAEYCLSNAARCGSSVLSSRRTPSVHLVSYLPPDFGARALDESSRAPTGWRVCARVCVLGKWRRELRRHRPGEPPLPRGRKEWNRGSCLTKVRHSSPRLMLSAPVGRLVFFFHDQPICRLCPSVAWQLTAQAVQYPNPWPGKLPCRDAPLETCPATWAGLHGSRSRHEGLVFWARLVTVRPSFLTHPVSCQGRMPLTGRAGVSGTCHGPWRRHPAPAPPS